MEVTHLFSCLVSPGKHGETERDIQGTAVPLSSKTFPMLSRLFMTADHECRIPIRFRMAEDGTQRNDVRDDLVRFLRNPYLEAAIVLGKRLQGVTTRKSGLGLMFLILGSNENSTRCVISRFPANEGVLAEAKENTLQIEFVERVFMKSAATYKAALYEGQSFDEHFWDGTAIDKQLLYGTHAAADYWIKEFLASEFRTTGPAGSRRLAIAMREGARAAPDIETKQQIVAAASLVPGFEGEMVSVASLLDKLHLSQRAKEEITKKLPGEHVLESVFELDGAEFNRNASYRSVELDNGGIMTAPTESFDDAFKSEVVDAEMSTYRYSSVGRVVDHRVKTRR